MNPSPPAESVSTQLEKLAQRQKALEERRRAHEIEGQRIEDEEVEIQDRLARLAGASAGPSNLQRKHKHRSSPFQPPPGDQLRVIVRILNDAGKLTRPELFAKLKSTGKQPRNLKQLSSLLTRLKIGGYVSFDQNHRWFATFTFD